MSGKENEDEEDEDEENGKEERTDLGHLLMKGSFIDERALHLVGRVRPLLASRSTVGGQKRRGLLLHSMKRGGR
jgi:hypothetical protein